jgi:hypothetical protein
MSGFGLWRRYLVFRLDRLAARIECSLMASKKSSIRVRAWDVGALRRQLRAVSSRDYRSGDDKRLHNGARNEI